MSDSSEDTQIQPEQIKQHVQQLFKEADTPEEIAARLKKKFTANTVHQGELAFALTVLLVDLASADQNFDQSEYGVIFKGVQRIFGLPAAEVTALIHRAKDTLKNLRGVSSFGDILRDQLDETQKKKVMKLIENVIMADGIEDGFETYMRQKFADLLGVPLEESISQ